MESFRYSGSRPGDDPGELMTSGNIVPVTVSGRSTGSCPESWMTL